MPHNLFYVKESAVEEEEEIWDVLEPEEELNFNEVRL